jgi:hypothetical protein
VQGLGLNIHCGVSSSYSFSAMKNWDNVLGAVNPELQPRRVQASKRESPRSNLGVKEGCVTLQLRLATVAAGWLSMGGHCGAPGCGGEVGGE